ncbi:MAG: glutathione S-transferase family protein [Tepidimonas sp.]|uniref:glutathione S-transferase family protein n=1 Tax=Tepidimonas sp. TaxID=2002775 RepID=UPI004054B11F
MKLKLFGTLTSPYVRKVRIVMAEKKLECQFVQEDPWAADTALPEINPLGKVPCLVIEGGVALFDSRVIVEYLDTLSPVGKLIPATGRERAEVKTWEALADGLLDAAVTVRLEQVGPLRAAHERSQAWIDRHLRKIGQTLQFMSRGLGDRPHCHGIHLTLADIAVGVALGYLDYRFPTIDWRSPYPNLARLHERLSHRPSFQDTLPPPA